MSAFEMPLKEWVQMVADREQCTTRCIYMRLSRGQLPYPPVRRVNARVIWVQVGPQEDKRQIKMAL